MKKRIGSLLIVVVLVASIFPATVSAASYPKCDSVAEAGQLIRKAMLARNKTVRLKYSFTSSDYDSKMKSLDKKFFESAVAHTGVPNEGDYLRWQYGGYTRQNTGTRQGNDYKLDISYNIKYYTTASEEAEISTAVRKILNSLHLDEKDDYNVVKSIYDYITDNVTYDNDAVKTGDVKAFTPYKAIVSSSHQAVCQGYSLLLYRMLLECGVDCRIVAADNGSKAAEDGHAWNLIKLGGSYYIADPTWDAKRAQIGGEYKYFLCGSKDFTDHEKYPRIHSYIRNHETAKTKYHADNKQRVTAFRKTSIKSLTHTKTALTAKWSRRYGIKGYQVQYGRNKDMSKASIKTVESNSKTSIQINKLKKGKKYYVRVRTYKVVDGKKYYSKWSNKKSVTLE